MDFEEHRIYANEELLKQAWINLIDNAIKFSPAGGVVEVSAHAKAAFTAVSVINSGVEIPETVQRKIFNKFYQTDKSHSAKGSGIGLAVVKRIVELHSGRIEVHSGEGRTMFVVEIPDTSSSLL